MTRTYYRGAKAAVVCFDLVETSTFQRAKHWVRELRSIEENCKVYLCGTKKDLIEDFSSSNPDMMKAVKTYALGTQSKLFLTSSKTGESVGKCMCVLSMCVINSYIFFAKSIYLFINFLLTAEMFNEIIQDFAANPENLQQMVEEVDLNKKSEKRYCCVMS